MASFGSFEIDREVYSGPTYTVYSATKSDDPGAEYAVKVFSILRSLDPEPAAELEGLLSDIERSCVQRIALQQQAAASSPFVSPIFETGRDERGVWYATRFYPRSVNKIINGKVALTEEALQHLVRSVVQGALDFKRACGRSHGEILPSNVQISKSERLSEAEVVLSDPLPGEANEAARYEQSDLRAVGELIYQLVLKRNVDFQWVMVPLDSTPDWVRTFGKNAPRWLDLCNRLLDPNLSLETVNLESVERELRPSQSSQKLRRVATLVGLFAGLCLLGGAAYLGIHGIIKSRHQHSAQAYRTTMEEVRGAINAGDFLLARQKLELAVKSRPADAAATQLQKEVGQRIEDRYQTAMTAARLALQKQDFNETTNQAGIALSMRPGDGAARSLISDANLGIAKMVAGIGREKQCQSAREMAKAAEEHDDWPAALAQWQRAQTLCATETEITQGLQVAAAMTKVAELLREVQGKTRGTQKEAQDAMNSCMIALKQLENVAAFADSPARNAAYRKRADEANQALAESKLRIEQLANQDECARAKQLAWQAEERKNWSSALKSWQDAQSKCKQDSDVAAGIAFATAMTSAQDKLDQAAAKANGTEAQAKFAAQLCDQILTQLGEAQSLAKGGGVRQTELEAKMDAATRLRKAADARLSLVVSMAQCDQAKKSAQEAEGIKPWSAALGLWETAKQVCGKEDQVITDGIRFASAITNVLWNLEQAKTKTNGTESDTKAAENLCINILAQLRDTGSLTGASPVRKKEVEDRAGEAKGIQSSLVQRVERAAMERACNEAKQAARKAESSKDWAAAATQWRFAQNKCPSDSGISNDIAFATAMMAGERLVESNAEQAKTEADRAIKLRRGDPAALALKMRAATKIEQTATNLIAACQYSEALALCDRHPDSDQLNSLRAQVSTLNQTIKQAKDDLDQGRWEAISRLPADCQTNPCFTNLIETSSNEKAQWEALARLTNQTSWTDLNSRLANVGQTLRQKGPFRDLQAWLGRNNPLGTVDQQLRFLQAKVGLNADLKKAEWLKRTDDSDYWYSQVDQLTKKYEALRKDGFLVSDQDLNSRKASLKAVEDKLTLIWK